MPQLCWYFQLHQPYRLADYSVFDLDISESYFEDVSQHNQEIFHKVAHKSYLPMLELLVELVNRHSEFVFAVSCSGVFLEQALEFEPKVIKLLQKLAKSGQVEFLAETYYHSLAALYSPGEFAAQVDQQEKLLKKLFKLKPQVFRNTELIYSNDVAELVQALGYHGMLTEAVPRYLGNRPKTEVYRSYTDQPLPLLLKHAELSDDIAFRFSDRNWHHHPLHADTYLGWLDDYYPDEVINLFMDFETFGEHQWADTGIFQFFEEVIAQVHAAAKSKFVTPTELLVPLAKKKSALQKLPIYDVPEPISWADVDRDLTAWVDNAFQRDTLEQMYQLEEDVLASKDKKLIDDWRRLQTSDHFYYMCTKWSADGDVHAYFSPYEDPWEAYRRFSIVLADLRGRIKTATS